MKMEFKATYDGIHSVDQLRGFNHDRTITIQIERKDLEADKLVIFSSPLSDKRFSMLEGTKAINTPKGFAQKAFIATLLEHNQESVKHSLQEVMAELQAVPTLIKELAVFGFMPTIPNPLTVSLKTQSVFYPSMQKYIFGQNIESSDSQIATYQKFDLVYYGLLTSPNNIEIALNGLSGIGNSLCIKITLGESFKAFV